MAETDPGGEVMRMADAPQRCAGCPVFSFLRDAVTSALLQGALGQATHTHEALVPRVPSKRAHRTSAPGVQKSGIERIARIRGVMHGCLGSIDNARRAISRAAHFGDHVPRATMIEILHATAVIQKEVQKGREALAGVR